jgi:hypothetical protein
MKYFLIRVLIPVVIGVGLVCYGSLIGTKDTFLNCCIYFVAFMGFNIYHDLRNKYKV